MMSYMPGKWTDVSAYYNTVVKAPPKVIMLSNSPKLTKTRIPRGTNLCRTKTYIGRKKINRFLDILRVKESDCKR